MRDSSGVGEKQRLGRVVGADDRVEPVSEDLGLVDLMMLPSGFSTIENPDGNSGHGIRGGFFDRGAGGGGRRRLGFRGCDAFGLHCGSSSGGVGVGLGHPLHGCGGFGLFLSDALPAGLGCGVGSGSPGGGEVASSQPTTDELGHDQPTAPRSRCAA